MNDTEIQIFRDAFRYLDAHSIPPEIQDSSASEAWWKKAAGDSVRLSLKWDQHPLMNALLLGIYDYLEEKAKEKNTDGLSQC